MLYLAIDQHSKQITVCVRDADALCANMNETTAS